MDGTLVEAWASLKSFQPKGKKNAPPDDPGNPTVDFHGEKRSNQTHASTTDPDALLARQGSGKEAKLSYNGNLLMENRHGLIVTAELLPANGTAERDAALWMLEQIPGNDRVTVGADKAYDTKDFVAQCRHRNVTPPVAQNQKRSGGSAIDGRTTRHEGDASSQKKRKRIEESFGWLKTMALMRKVRHRGIEKVTWIFTFAGAAYNLVRMRNLLASPVGAGLRVGREGCGGPRKRVNGPADRSRYALAPPFTAVPNGMQLKSSCGFDQNPAFFRTLLALTSFRSFLKTKADYTDPKL